MTQDGDAPGRRLTRAESTALTRERLLDAGRDVFVEEGYAQSSIYAIAERAGRTIGALYSQFGNKEGLFLALWDRYHGEVLEHYARTVAASADPGRVPATFGRTWSELLSQDPTMFRLFIEFWAQALRDPALKRRLVAALRDWRAQIVTVVRELAGAVGVTLSAPPEQVAIAAEALIDGFALHALADPDEVDAEVMARALDWLVGGLIRESTG